MENLWVLKAVLRGFVLASGLNLNLWKSSLMGVFVDGIHVNCRIFVYIGLLLGANPQKLSVSRPMLDVLRKRLGSWGIKYVSLEGRVVLINVVLSANPIFYLSFLKT